MPIDHCAFRPVPAALALAFYAAGAAANPQGGVVKAGSATIAPNGSRLDVIQPLGDLMHGDSGLTCGRPAEKGVDEMGRAPLSSVSVRDRDSSA